MLEDIRAQLHGVLKSDVGNNLLPVRLTRQWFGFWNDLLGKPLRPLKQESSGTASVVSAPRVREPAPVTVYVEWDSPKEEIEELLKGRGIVFRLMPIDRDEATKSWLEETVKQKPPVVFIGSDAIGGLEALKKLDASGELHTRVFGTPPPAATASA